ncbi:MAG: hypothetical protein M0T71_00270 [Actinomycetota bacterium]|nr:hypothetical protein [Actinomycetota bacterium]MDA8285797.1 hypothetical protein [Actinomycetota bacterium]
MRGRDGAAAAGACALPYLLRLLGLEAGEIAGWTSADRMVGASCARG